LGFGGVGLQVYCRITMATVDKVDAVVRAELETN